MYELNSFVVLFRLVWGLHFYCSVTLIASALCYTFDFSMHNNWWNAQRRILLYTMREPRGQQQQKNVNRSCTFFAGCFSCSYNFLFNECFWNRNRNPDMQTCKQLRNLSSGAFFCTAKGKPEILAQALFYYQTLSSKAVTYLKMKRERKKKTWHLHCGSSSSSSSYQSFARSYFSITAKNQPCYRF